ncbi:MAG: heme exporter protein CcmD [Hyphomicrobium sp.]
MDLGPHSAFILASYAGVAAVVAGLLGWLVYDGRRQHAALADLEARGVRRRSAKEPAIDSLASAKKANPNG